MPRMQALCCCLLLFALTGCDFFVANTNSGGGSVTGDYIYVGNGNNTYLAGFAVSDGGRPFCHQQLALQQWHRGTITGGDSGKHVSLCWNLERNLRL